jgi:hypothetical protein
MIVDFINQYLATEGKSIDLVVKEEIEKMAGHAFERQFGQQQQREGALRLSSIGRCLRQQAYNVLGIEPNGKEIDSRAKIVFYFGDLLEAAVMGLMRQAGLDVENVGLGQKTVEIDGVQGHPDGILTLPNLERVLVEVKSMSSFSFKDFEAGVIDEGYQFQIQAYLHALKLQKVCVVALNKDSGVLAEQVKLFDPLKAFEIRQRIRTLKEATKETLPERPYGPNEKGFLPWNCLYCGHHKTCWPEAEKVVVSGKYKLKVK